MIAAPGTDQSAAASRKKHLHLTTCYPAASSVKKLGETVCSNFFLKKLQISDRIPIDSRNRKLPTKDNNFNNNNFTRAETLTEEYNNLRDGYFGLPVPCDLSFDTETVGNVISKLKRGKASNIAGLTAEHLLFSHPILSVVLSRLFRLILLCGHVPNGFKPSYIVPVPKPKESTSKSLSCDDFRVKK